jgi:hypothetical protein
MPRSPNISVDIFTACLIGPIRVALLFHSGQYYCFSPGPLELIPLMRIEELSRTDGAKLALLDKPEQLLIAVVEPMSYQVYDLQHILPVRPQP